MPDLDILPWAVSTRSEILHRAVSDREGSDDHRRPSRRTAPLAVTDRGAGGPALLFVPGWCGDRDRLRPAARPEHRRIAARCPWTCRDHGDSPAPRRTSPPATSSTPLVATIDALGIDTVVPVGLSHAGWAAIELRRRLGAERVPGVVLMDWMVLGTPPGFADALAGLQYAGVGRRPRRPHLDVDSTGSTSRR